jgi:hypothetical protein
MKIKKTKQNRRVNTFVGRRGTCGQIKIPTEAVWYCRVWYCIVLYCSVVYCIVWPRARPRATVRS